MELKDLTTTVKSGLYNKKSQYREVSITGAVDYVRENFVSEWFASGIQAFYLSTRLIDSNGDLWLIPHLDVENPDHHDNISENIRTAQNFHTYLSESGLTSGVQIFATGTAFRFCLPFLVPPEYSDSFIAWTKVTPGIDPGTFARGKFMRVGGFRSHLQDTKKLGVHVQRFADHKEIYNLAPAKYRRIVAGPANLNEMLRDLPLILPQSTNGMPEGFKAILRPIRDKNRWRKSLIDFSKMSTPTKSNGRMVLPAGLDHLKKVGIITTHTNNIYRLSKCLFCNKPGGYVTQAGRLKCFHTSCSAGLLNDQGDRVGLAPQKWIPGFDDIRTAHDTPQGNPIDFEAALATARAKLKNALKAGEDGIILCLPGPGKTHGAYSYGIKKAEW